MNLTVTAESSERNMRQMQNLVSFYGTLQSNPNQPTPTDVPPDWHEYTIWGGVYLYVYLNGEFPEHVVRDFLNARQDILQVVNKGVEIILELGRKVGGTPIQPIHLPYKDVAFLLVTRFKLIGNI